MAGVLLHCKPQQPSTLQGLVCCCKQALTSLVATLWTASLSKYVFYIGGYQLFLRLGCSANGQKYLSHSIVVLFARCLIGLHIYDSIVDPFGYCPIPIAIGTVNCGRSTALRIALGCHLQQEFSCSQHAATFISHMPSWTG